MSVTASSSGFVTTWSQGDGNDLAGFERIEAIYEVGDATVVVNTTNGREIRITARHDLTTDRYVSEFEKRVSLKNGGQELRVWAHTPAYKRCTADDLASCLEAAVLEVDRVNVY